MQLSVNAEEKIDIVFVSVTTPIATQIIEELKTRYTRVKHILFLGELIDEEFERKLSV
jgi:hypothetical protein